MVQRSIWFKDGVSTFPVKQPMVGLKEFYVTFKEYLKDLKSAPMARIFPVIGQWGSGKSRIAFELESEAIGIDKGWIICNKDGQLEKVRLLEPDLADGILPVYIRYSQMSHDYLYGDNWVGYGAYVALSSLADEEPPKKIQGNIIKNLQDALRPIGFSPSKLGTAIEKGQHSPEELLENIKQLDDLVDKGMDYLKKFGIDHMMVIVDEVESETELFRYGLVDDDETRKKLDGVAIKVITQAIKHEDSRSRHPRISYLLLCSPAIGDQIKALEALDRRGEMLEIHQYSYSDISDYVEHLQQEGILRDYPEGLVEAAYTIAGGNFGWLNVIMAYCDQYLDEQSGADAGEILEDRAVAITRFKEKLIDNSQFQYISVLETDPNLPVIKRALLRQLPYPVDSYDAETRRVLLEARQIDGTPLFKKFFSIALTKAELGMHLHQNGYRLDEDNEFVNESSGETFNLDVLLRSLGTFSIQATKGEYIVGRDKDTFLEQIRMLYPKDGVEDAAFILYDFIQEKALDETTVDYIGPNFSFLERLDRRYAVKKGLSNYLVRDEDDKRLKEHLKELRKDHEGEIKRVLKGFARVLEIDYPQEEFFTVNDVQAVRTKVSKHIYLGTHPDNKVDIIWDNQAGKLKDVLSHKNIMDIGAHPIIVVSMSAATEDELKKIKQQYSNTGRYIIFFHLTNLQKEVLEILSVDTEYMDIRESAHQLAPQFRGRVRAIRDEVSKRAKEWFEEIDKGGYVLRPLIFTKSEEDNLPVLAEGFARMLRFDASVEELGTKENIKMDIDDYNRFERTLSHTQVRAKLAKDGYQDAGLFVKEHDGYHVYIPAAFSSILSYVGNSRKTLKNIQDYFFFSAVDTIKPKKIVEQWCYFLQQLNVVKVEDNQYVSNISKTDLETKLDKVDGWLREDYDDLVNSFKGVISDGKISDLFNYKKMFEQKVEKARDTFRKIELQPLRTMSKNDNEAWKEQLSYLAEFHSFCDYIYDEEQWKKTGYNERKLEELRLDDNNISIWLRIRLIERFHEHISKIQEKVSDQLEKKMDEIRQNSSCDGYTMPISPVINALERYNAEIKFAKDYSQSSKHPTMVPHVETLAYKLSVAEYKAALKRLYTILNEAGLKRDTFEWKEDSGVVGRYNRMKKLFCELVEGYLDKRDAVHRWLNYFSDAPDGVAKKQCIKNLKSVFKSIEFFLDGGFDEAIDDKEAELVSKPLEFIEHMEKVLNGHKSDVTSMLTNLTEVQTLAREQRNKLYDRITINAVNYIRNVNKQDLIKIDESSLPEEDTYKATKENVKALMKDLEQEGNNFFIKRGAECVTFAFLKDVVQKNADLEWNAHEEEKRELEEMGLVETKVVLRR